MEKEIEGLNEVYRVIAQLTSIDDCLVLYQQFKGLTINFPTKLMAISYVRTFLKSEVRRGKSFGKLEIQKYSRSFDYSERQIRRILKEVKSEVEQEEETSLPYVSRWIEKQYNRKEDS